MNEAGTPIGGGCFDVVDATGAYSSFCDDDGDGVIELASVPPGDATITQTVAPSGFNITSSQVVYVLPDQYVVANFYNTAVVIETPAPTVEPTVEVTAEPTVAPTEVVPTEDAATEEAATEEAAATETEEATAESEGLARSNNLISPMAFGNPGVGCEALNEETGLMLVTPYIPGDENDEAPTVSYTLTDRFGNVSEPITATMAWNSDLSRWEIEREVIADQATFTITAGGNTYTVMAACSLFNPIDTLIQTMAVDSEGAHLPDGTQIDAGTPFGDTAQFVNLTEVERQALAGQPIIYNLYLNDASCSGSPVESYTVYINSDGTIPPTPMFTPAVNGVYDWHVVLPEFAPNFSEAKSPCGSETVVVGEVETSVATTMKDGDGTTIPQGSTLPIGTSVYDTAVLNGATSDAGGTVTYELVKGTCGSTTSVWGPETVTVENGTVPDAPSFTPTELGTYHWIVSYSGDANNQGDVSPCGDETFSIAAAEPTITTAMFQGDGTGIGHGSTVPLDTAVYDTTTIDGAYGTPTGEVTYTLVRGTCGNFTEINSVTLDLNEDGSFPPSPTWNADAAGTYHWIVEYSGDDLNAPATSGCGEETFVIEAVPTGVATGPQVSDADGGFTDLANNAFIPSPADVRDTATITGIEGTGPVPAGSVTFKLYAGSSCTGTVVAQFKVPLNEDGTVPPTAVVPDLGPGQYNWQATYSGDENYQSSTSPCGDEQFFVTNEGVGAFITTQVKASNGSNVADGGRVNLGSTAYDTATFHGDIIRADGKIAKAGTVTYHVYATGSGGATCENPLQSWSFPVAVGDDVPQMSAADGYRFLIAGTYDFQAVFTPTGNGPTISSICGTETVVVNPVTPTITTTMSADGSTLAHNGRVTLPATVGDGVTVTYPNGVDLTGIPAPTGTLTYQLYKSASCEGTPVFTDVQNVSDGNWPSSATHPLSVAADAGKYNWVVTFTPTAGETNFNRAVSGCNKETFSLDVQPVLTTAMFQSEDGTDATSVELPDDGSVTVLDFVRDTGTLTNFGPNAKGSVTFNLHQGGTCQGTILFSNTIAVQNGVLVSGTDWFQIRLHGEYSWSAKYSGDTANGGFTTGADSDCLTETFTATVADPPPSMETVMRNGDNVIPHLNYISRPASVNDQAIFTNLSDGATGKVKYELYDTATCQNAPVFMSEKDVVNGLAPRSDSYEIPRVGPTAGLIYSWKVTFVGTDKGEDVELVSPCSDEQFRIYDQIRYSAVTDCSYNPTTNQSTYIVTLHPQPVPGSQMHQPTVTMQPYNIDLSPADEIVVSDHWTITYTNQDWRRLTGRAEWSNGSFATFDLFCNTTPWEPELTTTMYARDGENDPVLLENGDTVGIGTSVFDTTQVTEKTSTVVITGTLTYQLYSDANCEVPVGGPVVRQLDNTPWNQMPNSNDVTLNQAGTYYWVVTFNPPAGNYPDNAVAVSPCGSEFFQVVPNETAIETVMEYANGTVIEQNEVVPIDSEVRDTATITGLTSDATGTIKYTLIRAESCDDADPQVIATETVNLTDGAIPDFPGSAKITDVGTYHWIVEYSGDANNDPSISPCGDETFVVEQTEPTIETVMKHADGTVIGQGSVVPIDSIVIDTATIEGQSDNATGKVTYTLIRAESCDDEDPEVVTTLTVDLSEGTIPDFAPGVQIENVGTYHWIVEYSGDDNNAGAISPCGDETFVVEKAEPAIETVMRFAGEEGAVIANDDTVAIDSLVIDTATISEQSENATGKVTYQLFRGTVCGDEDAELITEVTVDLTDGTIPNVDPAVQIENIGVYFWVVSYDGDDNNTAAVSDGCDEWFEVEQAEPVIETVMKYADEDGTVIEQGGIVPIDSTVIDTAIISGQSDNATGTVTYTLILAENCEVEDPEVIVEYTVDLSEGTIPDFAPGIKIDNVGTYNWIVTYSGDDNNAEAISECGEETFVVEQAEPVIETVMKYADEEGIVIEQGGIVPVDSVVIDTATISGQSENATGTVTYTLIRAESCEVEEPAVIAEFTVDLSEGTIPDFAPGIKIENVGTYHWIVEYSGDDNNAGAISPCGDETFVVEQAEPVVETVMKYADEDGTVIEQGGIVAIDSSVIDTATISGQSDNATGTVTYTLILAENCEVEDPEVIVEYTVDLSEGTIPDFAPGIKIENVGTYHWIVEYSGDDNNSAAISPCGDETFVVEQAEPVIETVMKYAGENGAVIENGMKDVPIDSVVIDTATISGQSDNATGTVTYALYHGGVCENGVLTGATQIGTWEFDLEDGLIPDVNEGTKIENVGLYTWIVTYSGDENNESAISPCGIESFKVQPTTPVVKTTMKKTDGTVVENGDMLERGDYVLDTTIITGLSDNATGTVTYQLYADALCETPLGSPYVVTLTNGKVPDSLPIQIANAGSYYWVVTYSGDINNYAAESGCGEEFFHIDTVAPAVVTTMKYEDGTVIENDEVVLTGSVVLDTAVLVGATDDVSGTVTYQLYSDAMCTVPVGDPQEVLVTNGQIPDSATFTVTEPGSYYWVVTYSGDTNNLAAVSDCGKEFFQAELPPVTPEPGDSTPPPVTGLPSTGSGQGSVWFVGSLAAIVTAAFVASALRISSKQ